MTNLSIIVVSWNAREYLRQCLESIRRAKPDCVVEIIIVDNASVDGSAEMVEQQFPECQLVRAGANLGFARANNLAMERACGDAFALVNSDALVHPGTLEAIAAYLDAHPNVGMVGPRVLGGDGNLQRTSRHLPSLWNSLCRVLALDRAFGGRGVFSGLEVPPTWHDRTHQAEVLSGCFCIARRRAVETVGGLDENFFFYGEDIDWCKRFGNAGWKLVFLANVTATHFGGGSSSTAPLQYSIESLRATLKYWRKHHGRLGHALCFLLLVANHGIRLLLRGGLHLLPGGKGADGSLKIEEDATCLRWLLLGIEARTGAPQRT